MSGLQRLAQSQDSLDFRALDIGRDDFHDFYDEEGVVKKVPSQAWWHTLSVPALRRQRQAGLGEFEASLVHIDSSRTARTRETLSQKINTRKGAWCGGPVDLPLGPASLYHCRGCGERWDCSVQMPHLPESVGLGSHAKHANQCQCHVYFMFVL